MRLAKRQVQEYAIALSQNPAYASADEPDYDQRFNVPERWWTAEPKDFVNLFCAVVYDLLRRILYVCEDVSHKEYHSTVGSYPDIALGCHHGVHRTY